MSRTSSMRSYPKGCLKSRPYGEPNSDTDSDVDSGLSGSESEGKCNPRGRRGRHPRAHPQRTSRSSDSGSPSPTRSSPTRFSPARFSPSCFSPSRSRRSKARQPRRKSVTFREGHETYIYQPEVRIYGTPMRRLKDMTPPPPPPSLRTTVQRVLRSLAPRRAPICRRWG